MDPLDRLELLERIVAGMVQRNPRRSEQSVPNYLTIKPDGTVGALFTGGVQMIEATVSGYQPSNSLGWVDAGGVVREFLQGQGVPPLHQMQLFSQADAADTAGFRVQTLELGGGGSSIVSAFADDNAGNVAASTILDSLGRSSYAQLATLAQRSLDFGVATINFPGAQQATTLTVAHAIGRIPLAVVATIDGAVGGASVTLGTKNYDALDFEIDAWCSVVLNGNVNISWIAIG